MILAVAIAFVTFEICNLLTSCGMVMAAHAKKDRTLELASHSTVRGKTSGQAKRTSGYVNKRPSKYLIRE